jgi:hypothetical protein
LAFEIVSVRSLFDGLIALQVNFQVTPDVDDEFGNDYIIYQDMNNGNNGLRVYVDGQPVVGILTFLGLYYGSYTKLVEIYRGPSAFTYEPVWLIWEALCDGDHFSVTIPFTVSYVQTCARAEFHRKLTSFAITSFRFA